MFRGEALWELVWPVVQSVLHTEGADKVGRTASPLCGPESLCAPAGFACGVKTVTAGRKGALRAPQKPVAGWPVSTSLPAAVDGTPVLVQKLGLELSTKTFV